MEDNGVEKHNYRQKRNEKRTDFIWTFPKNK